MIIPGFQPIQFTEDNELCSCNSNDGLMAQAGDTTTLQAKMQVCANSIDLITNGNFAVPDTGWNDGFAFTGYTARSESGNDQEMQTLRSIMGVDLSYQIEVDILSNTGTPLLVYFGTNKIAEISDTGKFKLSGICESNGTDGKLRFISDIGNAVTIERVALYPLESKFGITIQQLQSNGSFSHKHLRTLAQDVADANYTFFHVDRDVIVVNFDWDYITDATNGLGLDYGCYRIGVVGECVNYGSILGLFDAEFNMPSDYPGKIGGYLSETSFPFVCDTAETIKVIDGQMVSDAATASAAIITQANPLLPLGGLTYNFEINIGSIGAPTAYIEIYFGGSTSAQFTTAGTHSFALVPVLGNTDELEIRINDPFNVGINVDYCRITSTPSFVEPDYVSNTFAFNETQVCTKLIHAINAQDAFGLRFESALYVPRVRLKSSVRANDFPSKVETHTDGFNTKHIDFFEQRKTLNLQIQNIPEFLVDWFSLFRGFSSVFADSIEYVVESDIDISWNKFCDRGKLEIEVGEKRQELITTKSKGKTAVNTIGNTLVRMRDRKEEITFMDGEQIEIKG